MTREPAGPGRARRPRGSRRAVGGDGVPAAQRASEAAQGPGKASGSRPAQTGIEPPASSGRAPEPVPETLDEVADEARRDDWLSSQRPPHWG